ncbi:hypothetical protein ACVIHI_006970 [Bradyrhizobium sp. USDA 4524]|uniref:hypothetical protein n=1 Tax=unclassified Bradyrhizobium TaxID=2631580 RepID=UPI0020A0C871|nr:MULTISPECIES: hypothetical protein [unclassified Bradyrhizobium]MCP1840113.1 hypothetical protein [Bradyrhizobium sp. USDA 4538]MCP1900676.1 hypothetical protein [Bradyrhizobium sp. USDA 4537]MCP1993668.1 hypothetical protein [Bradyrhizobium sp. USDA 4539]
MTAGDKAGSGRVIGIGTSRRHEQPRSLMPLVRIFLAYATVSPLRHKVIPLDLNLEYFVTFAVLDPLFRFAAI